MSATAKRLNSQWIAVCVALVVVIAVGAFLTMRQQAKTRDARRAVREYNAETNRWTGEMKLKRPD